MRVGFGALRLTGPGAWEPTPDREAARAVLRRAVDLGVTHIDTADSYGLGDNEELIAEALYPYPAELTIATKAGQSRPGRSAWVPLGRPEYLRQQAELSLRRLRVDRLDLFYLHRVDPKVPFEDQLGALRELRDEGKVAGVGLSEVTREQLAEAEKVVPITAVQNLYNWADRTHEPVVEYCTDVGTTFVPWLPVAGGRSDARLTAVAAETGATPTQVALAWLLHRSPVVLPIPGTRSPEHLAENVAAATIELTAEQVRRLA
ncbi:oxidoreductase [Virgisporangium aurantiacum]|uniref:Oxidoreductase n=2 Tax=Virgisporangium aurantiacum TaxID=175570 RepID=A0A8J4E612_9ACTN|nr:oxidoreductase [Virgisporangium aurantiacum]